MWGDELANARSSLRHLRTCSSSAVSLPVSEKLDR
jgi:hypothetical protein